MARSAARWAASDACSLAIGGVERDRAARGRGVGGAPGQHARRFEIGRQIRQLELHGLEVADRLAERLAAARVRERFVERGLADAERLRGNRDRGPPSSARIASRKPRPASPSSALGVDTHVVERRGPCSRVRGRRANPTARRVNPGRVERHEKRADAARPRAPGSVDANTIATSAASALATQTFVPREHVAAIVEPGHRLLVGGVGSGLRLRQRERADARGRTPAASATLSSARRCRTRAIGSTTSELLTVRITASVALA